MKIQLKVLIAIFALVLVSGLASTIVSETVSVAIIGEEVRAHLEDVAQSRAAHVETFLDKEKKSIRRMWTMKIN
jgi:sensor domain CHASE-containing protein